MNYRLPKARMNVVFYRRGFKIKKNRARQFATQQKIELLCEG